MTTRDYQANRSHVDEHLEVITSKSRTLYPYGRHRGFYTGQTVFKRKDGKALTEKDIDALKGWSSARFSYVKGEPGELEAVVKFTHDSTD